MRGNPHVRFWRAVGVVTPSLTLIRWTGLGTPCTSFKNGLMQYLTGSVNRIATAVKRY
jgi:hypothetical protein